MGDIDINKELEAFDKDTRLLVEAGYIALKQIDEKSAQSCFYAAIALRPNESLPVVGLGQMELFKLNIEEAKKMFNMVLEKEKGHEMAQTLLAVANVYSLEKPDIDQGSSQIEEILKKTKDPAIVALCKDTLNVKKHIHNKMKDLHPLESKTTKNHFFN